MPEWLNGHAWKVCVPQKGTASSNLALSAIFLEVILRTKFQFVYISVKPLKFMKRFIVFFLVFALSLGVGVSTVHADDTTKTTQTTEQPATTTPTNEEKKTRSRCDSNGRGFYAPRNQALFHRGWLAVHDDHLDPLDFRFGHLY